LKQKNNENKDFNVRKKRKKKSSVNERKEYLQREKNERPEAIWTRPSCLKFFQIEELKSNDEELEKQGKRRFFLEGIIWTMKEKKERNQEANI
jgi:hypothetical protein